MSAPTPRSGLLRQSGLTGVAAGVALVSGLALDAAIAFRYGAGRATDAYFVGGRLPFAVATIVLVAANQSLVPIFSTWFVQQEPGRARRLASEVCALATLAAAVLTLLLAVGAPLVVSVTAPGFGDAQRQTAVEVLRVMSLTLPLATAAEALRAYLNAQYAFVAPALMNVMLNAVAVAVIVGASGGVIVAAWAMVLGGVARLAFLLLMAWRRGLRVVLPRLGRGRDPEVVRALRRTLRPLATGGLAPLARVGEVFVGSFLPAGSISILNYGNRLVSGVGGSVFFRSIIVALLPRLTARAAEDDLDGVRRVTARGIVLMLCAALPITALTTGLAGPVTRLVFVRGSFDAADARLLATVLLVLALAMPADALLRALLAPFFARLDTVTPLRNAVYGVVVNLVLLPLLVLPLRGSQSAVLGAAAAHVLAQWVQAAHARHRLRQDVGVVSVRDYARPLVVVTVACLATAGLGGVLSGRWVDLDAGSAVVLRQTVLVGVPTLGVLVAGMLLAWRFGLRQARTELRRRTLEEVAT